MLQDLSSAVWGDQIVEKGLPRVEAYFGAQLVPLRAFPDNDPLWGVYRSDGSLIEVGAYKRGPGRQLLGQSEQLSEKFNYRYIDGSGIYCGFGNYHFGHYLLSTLSRFWLDLRRVEPYAKIYMHIIGEVKEWINIPFIKRTLSVFNITDDDIVPIREPLKIRRLIIPAPSFIEQSLAFKVFSDCGCSVGRSLLDSATVKRRGEPVYFSKERLKGGVWNMNNEADLVSILRQSGVRIVYPEEMDLSEQIRIFAEHNIILGLSGSAFHLSLLSEGGHRIIGICHSQAINSNFLLIDKIKDNKSSYYYVNDTMLLPNPDPGFSSTFRFSDPQMVGRELIKLLS